MANHVEKVAGGKAQRRGQRDAEARMGMWEQGVRHGRCIVRLRQAADHRDGAGATGSIRKPGRPRCGFAVAEETPPRPAMETTCSFYFLS